MASCCKTCAEPYTVADIVEVECPSELSALVRRLVRWRFRSNVRHRETVRVVATTECTERIKVFACPLCLKAKSGCGLTVARLPCRAVSFLKSLDLRKLILDLRKLILEVKVLESRLCFLQGKASKHPNLQQTPTMQKVDTKTPRPQTRPTFPKTPEPPN